MAEMEVMEEGPHAGDGNSVRLRKEEESDFSAVMCTLILCGICAIIYFTHFQPPPEHTLPVTVHHEIPDTQHSHTAYKQVPSTEKAPNYRSRSSLIQEQEDRPATRLVHGHNKSALIYALAQAEAGRKPSQAAASSNSTLQNADVVPKTLEDFTALTCAQFRGSRHSQAHSVSYSTAVHRLQTLAQAQQLQDEAKSQGEAQSTADTARIWEERSCWRNEGFKGMWLQDVWLFLNLFQFLPSTGTFLDYRAHDGLISSSTHFYEAQLNWTGICIEPAEGEFNSLAHNRPKCNTMHGAVRTDPVGESDEDVQTSVNITKVLQDQQTTRLDLVVLHCDDCGLALMNELFSDPGVEVKVILASRAAIRSDPDKFFAQLRAEKYFMPYTAPDFVFIQETS